MPRPPRSLSLTGLLLLLAAALPATGRADLPPLDLEDLGSRPGGPALTTTPFLPFPGAMAASPAPAGPRDGFTPRPGTAGSIQALAGTPDWAFESDVAIRELGTDVATAGDVNGDGYSDVVALGRVSPSGDAALYLFFGGPGGPALAPGYPLTNLPRDPSMINAAGDVDGDGHGDVVIGWPGATSGTVRVYYGDEGGFDLARTFTRFVNFTTSYGAVVGTAGDVDNDGDDEVIIGSPNSGGWSQCANPAGLGYGRVDVLYGDPTGLSNSREWIFFGCRLFGQGAGCGTAAAAAGDVNGDGFGDIVIGTPGADTPLPGIGGRIDVIYGSASGLPLVPGFSNVGTTNGAPLHPTTTLGSFGATAITAGDVNGDGFSDIAVGSPNEDALGFTDAGAARVFLGGPSGITATTFWQEFGFQDFFRFGSHLEPAGDIGGDGLPDLIVGSASRANLFENFGTTLFSSFFSDTHTPGAFATAGDVNGDGISDAVLGEAAYADGQASEGRVRIHYGRNYGPEFKQSFTQVVDLDARMGEAVAPAGDVNADGFDDLLVGAPMWGGGDEGAVILYLGGLNGPSTTLSGIFLGDSEDRLGSALAAGDFNGDGLGDIAVGGPQTQAARSGLVQVWYGGASLPLSRPPDRTLSDSAEEGARFGAALATGDFNGDGYADLAVGSPYDYGTDFQQGRVYVYFGSASGLGASPGWNGAGSQAGEHYGASLAGTGDIDGDGFSDLVVGAPDYDRPAGPPFSILDCGRVFVHRGGPTAPHLETGGATLEGSGNDRFGAAVAHVGDVDGDGYSDIGIGSPTYSDLLGTEGRAAVHVGSAQGLKPQPRWTQAGLESKSQFGASICGAGDVDGDGLDDVLVGAPFEDSFSGVDAGRARLYLGPLPAGGASFRSPSGALAGSELGAAVANLGDVNGDGWSDFLLGAPGFDGLGEARLHLGAFGIGRVHFNVAARPPGLTLIQHLGATDPAGFYLLGYGRSAAGRTRVRMQWEVEPVVGLPAPTLSGLEPAFTLTGAPGPVGSIVARLLILPGVRAGVPYAWRMRSLSRSVYFPTSPWISPARNGDREWDLRAPGTWVTVEDEVLGAPAVLALSAPAPNPARGSSVIGFALPQAGEVRLDVLDLQGRRVRSLVEGARAAGPHRAAWDGSDEGGRRAAAGVYFYRLQAGGKTLSRKLVVLE